MRNLRNNKNEPFPSGDITDAFISKTAIRLRRLNARKYLQVTIALKHGDLEVHTLQSYFR